MENSENYRGAESLKRHSKDVTKVSEKQQRIVWFIWLLTLPPFIYIVAEHTYDVLAASWLPVLSFTVLIIIASLFPIQIRSTSIVPLHGISLAIFLHFGLIIEILVTQIALFTTLTRLKISRNDLYRYPLNSLLLLATSLGAGGMFYLFGGVTGGVITGNFTQLLLPVLIYVVIFFFLNNGLIYLIRYYILGISTIKFFDEPMKWQALTGILIVPVGLTLAVLYEEMSYAAVLMIGIPIISVSLILKIINESKRTTALLKKVSAFGHEVNHSLDVETIINKFINTCNTIFPSNGIYLFERRPSGDLKPIYTHNPHARSNIKILYGDHISQYVFTKGVSCRFNSKKEWQELENENIYQGVQSVLSAPAIVNHTTVGVITLTSDRKNAFEKSHQMVLEIIANYLSVAVQNARYIEETKKESERCSLTDLYNYKYFENLLIEEYGEGVEENSYAIVLLDLDHFKLINDTYGHQSGNEVLAQVAAVLSETVGDLGVTARYGGEEFVVLLKNIRLPEASKTGEKLRRAIESHLFVVNADLDGGERKTVRLTASIGVAAKSDKNEEPLSVLRNADRAMYTGAKQKGRNKVAQFS